MSSSWIRTAFKYALMFAPAAVLTGLVSLVALGAWITAMLREPSKFQDAPVLIQKLTRDVYWHTRKHWHTIPECAMFDPELLYRPRPGECVFQNAEFRTTMHFDERGARKTASPAALANGVAPGPRIVILGDSHAMGWGVEDDETFASFLASEYGYQTVNLAVSSYATPREMLRLRRDFELAPDDIVVIQYCDNDFEENLHFASDTGRRAYEPADLQALFNYQPTAVSALPIAGLLMRLFWQDFLELLPGSGDTSAANSPGPSSAFLRVLDSYPQLRRDRLIVIAINGPGLGTHLTPDEFAAAGIPLIVPTLLPQDFLAIDDHMRPQGHRAVAAAIGAGLSDLKPFGFTGPVPAQ